MKQGKLKLIEFLFGYQKRSYSTFRLITTYDLCLITLEVKVKIVSAKTQSKIWRIFGITTRLMTSRTGSNFSASCIQNRNFQTSWMFFFFNLGTWCEHICQWAQGRRISDILWRLKRFPGSFNNSNITLLWMRKSQIDSPKISFIFQTAPENNLRLYFITFWRISVKL